MSTLISLAFTAALAVLTAAPALEAPAPVFEPDATLRALGHDEGRRTALNQLVALTPADRTRAAAFGERALAKALSALAADPKARIGHRLRAVEALALLVGVSAVPALAERLRHVGTPEELAVARAAAVALRGLHADAELATMAGADDPEIRATVAAAGANPEDLCGRLGDPWPVVRGAAARGLARHPDRAVCVAAGLTDRDPSVRSAALETIGAAGVQAAGPVLRTLANDSAAPVILRAQAVVALGRLGDAEPARKILATHLAKGGIVPLAEAAVSALAATDTAAHREMLRRALTSESGVVVASAARVLAALGDTEARPALEQARGRVDARHRDQIDAALARLTAAGAPPVGEAAPGSTLGDDPADADPE